MLWVDASNELHQVIFLRTFLNHELFDVAWGGVGVVMTLIELISSRKSEAFALHLLPGTPRKLVYSIRVLFFGVIVGVKTLF